MLEIVQNVFFFFFGSQGECHLANLNLVLLSSLYLVSLYSVNLYSNSAEAFNESGHPCSLQPRRHRP